VPYCSACETDIQAEAYFCPNCGTSLQTTGNNPGSASGSVLAAPGAGTMQKPLFGAEAAQAYLKRKNTDSQFNRRVQKCVNDQELNDLLKAEGYNFARSDLNTALCSSLSSGNIEAEAESPDEMKGDLRGWGIGLIILGFLHFVFAGFLNPVWGAVIIIIGFLNLVIISRNMFIVNGVALIIVGLLNIISTISMGAGGWVIFGAFQIYWGVKEIFKYEKYSH